MTRLARSHRLPLLLFASVAALGVALVAGGGSWPRTMLAIWFLLACPGLALAPLVRLHDALGTVTVAIALSIAIDTIVASALLYCGAWSPAAAYAILAAITIGGAARQLAAPARLRR